MSDKILFSESQRFKQILIWMLLFSIFIFVSVPVIYGFIKQIFFGQSFGNKPISMEGLFVITIVSIIIPLIPIVLFRIMKLETLIKEEGIYVRYFPFQTKYKFCAWNELTKCYVRQYSPVREYGGWGIKGLGNNRALNISGNKGIQLETKDGNKLLIGTRKPDEISYILKQFDYWMD